MTFEVKPTAELKTSNDLEVLDVQRHVPVNLRQSGDNGSRMLISQRVRKSPFWHLSQEAGCWCYEIYNHMYHPRAYVPLEEGGLLQEYKYLTEDVTLWNVAVERQIQVKGPDAAKLVDLAITRSVDKLKVGKARYVILCNEEGGILNDPVLLRPAEDEFWFSLSDTDIALWLQALNLKSAFDCTVREIDVAPVQIQGPKATALMADLFGEQIHEVPYYGLLEGEVNGCPVIVSRTGFSGEAGYEIYLYDASVNAERLWYHLLDVGKAHNIKVIAPGHIRRIEAGILSHGQDMDPETNPYQVGLGWQVDLNKSRFVGKEALARIKSEGVTSKLAGLKLGGKQIDWYPADFYIVYAENEAKPVGYVTSAFYSPTQGCNIGYAMLPESLSAIGTQLEVQLPEPYAGGRVPAEVTETPFKPPEFPGTGLTQTGRKL
ncbi:aminomethyl transferase family protein [Salicibibacter halophilus]|uniref:Aminomethyl transferase family protein n=1 Tax=Salicibibacter halophilus TaxID=2502791 RepID=A0A514LGZ7_9BACI|nr:glycine cleavage T C-terminal barrel domain-containing protein [Salicibibacter halophilus]QDI91109.1 aminomethyl transferase family protein [Salicibibacter halophilus]